MFNLFERGSTFFSGGGATPLIFRPFLLLTSLELGLYAGMYAAWGLMSESRDIIGTVCHVFGDAFALPLEAEGETGLRDCDGYGLTGSEGRVRRPSELDEVPLARSEDVGMGAGE